MRNRTILLTVAVVLGALLVLHFLRDKQFKEPSTAQASTPPPDGAAALEHAAALDEGVAEDPAEVAAAAPSGEAGLFVKGTVVSSRDGAPVADAQVRVLKKEPTGIADALGVELEVCTTHTDAKGGFVAPVNEPNLPYVVSVEAAGFVPRPHQVRVDTVSPPPCQIELAPYCSMSGVVVARDGRPVEGAVPVLWVSEEGRRYECARAKADTGLDGRFCIEELRSNNYILTARVVAPAGHGSGNPLPLPEGVETHLYLKPGDHLTDVRLVLPSESEYEISGRVQTADGHPIEGARVWTGSGGLSRNRMVLGMAAMCTDKAGQFYVDAVADNIIGSDNSFPKNAFDLYCEAEGFEPGYAPGVPWGSKAIVITLIPEQRGAIAGVVVDSVSGKPVAGAFVDAWQVDTEWGERRRIDYEPDCAQQSDEQGAFVLQNVPAGSASLVVAHPDYGMTVLKGSAHVEAGREVSVSIALDPPGTLEIHVKTGSGVELNPNVYNLQAVPLDVLPLEEDLPKPFTCGRGYAPRYASWSGISAAGCLMRAVGGGAEGGKWVEEGDGQWRREVRMQAGRYLVRVCVQKQVPFAVQEVSIEAGERSELFFELGAEPETTGSLCGDYSRDGEALVALVPLDAPAALPMSIPADSGYIRALSTATDVYGAIKAPVPGFGYDFSGMPPGEYMFSLYTLNDDESAFVQELSQQVIIEAGKRHKMDL